MNPYREFYAKTVDQAIEDACRFFNVTRDALEVDIICGGSAGIFGLGAKKACVQARRCFVLETSEGVENEMPVPTDVSLAGAPDSDAEEMDYEEDEDKPAQSSLSWEERAQLREPIQTLVRTLLLPIGGEVNFSVNVETDPILVHITDDQSSGLIIGRDGQTLAALQYLVNRIAAKSWAQCPRIQLDAGDYRQKQEEQLQGMALFLSQKAKNSGKVQSTRPLSSFHRRVVHMALQDDFEIQTRSKGDGPLKRVLIFPSKQKQNHKARKHQAGARTAQS